MPELDPDKSLVGVIDDAKRHNARVRFKAHREAWDETKIWLSNSGVNYLGPFEDEKEKNAAIVYINSAYFKKTKSSTSWRTSVDRITYEESDKEIKFFEGSKKKDGKLTEDGSKLRAVIKNAVGELVDEPILPKKIMLIIKEQGEKE